MTIQYIALGFEPTTFGTLISSHNHGSRPKVQNNLRQLRTSEEEICFCLKLDLTSKR